MKKSLYTLVFLYSFSLGCNYDSNRYGCQKFVKKYRDEDFSKFKNIGLAIRSYGRNGITIYISDELDKGLRKYPYMITFYGDAESVKNTSCRSVKDSCAFDTVKLNRLALNFLKYDISKLMVDEDNNVFIGIGSSERMNLVRFSDKKFIEAEYKKDWQQVNDYWYFKKD
jgi:hypothetical protein